MYVKIINSCNIGPIENIRVKVDLHENGDPKPIILVGENGTGKSTVLSNIVDSLYEMANLAYSNVMEKSGNGHQYYKALLATEVRVGYDYMYSYIEFVNVEQQPIQYVFKNGKIKYEDFKKDTNIELMKKMNGKWKEILRVYLSLIRL